MTVPHADPDRQLLEQIAHRWTHRPEPSHDGAALDVARLMAALTRCLDERDVLRRAVEGLCAKWYATQPKEGSK